MKSLEYHKKIRPGKVGTLVEKQINNKEDLSLAYTPGVADVCHAIKDNPALVRDYTNKGRTVAIVTNGTAVLGLGDIGPLAAKPVMEGKVALMKVFGGVDAVDINVDERDPQKVVDLVRAISPTYGAINLEDIKAPDCFFIEEELKKIIDIPVFHDDQHGTAVCVVAALLRALAKKSLSIDKVRIVLSGAGASALATAHLLLEMGIKKEQITVVDRAGVIFAGREENMNPYKKVWARNTERRTLADACKGAHVIIGLSSAGIMKPEMVASMAEQKIVFGLANPIPEISPSVVQEVDPHAIALTGRSDDPNQVNNVLCFPFLLRAVLDVQAKDVTKGMLMAAAQALADAAEKKDSIVADIFDDGLLSSIAPAVVEAAIKDGVASSDFDVAAYKESLLR